MQTSKELVRNALTFNHPERVPRDLWTLPCVEKEHPGFIAELLERFPSDIGSTENVYNPSPKEKGSPYEVGTYVDEWGCVFSNIHYGVIGEVKEPLIADIEEASSLKAPYEILPANWDRARDIVNRSIDGSELFIKTPCFPRPWERLQFLRGTENAMMDVMMPEEGAGDLIRSIHDFYMKELEFWVSTDVDAIMFMDDWGTQRQLLIPPPVWRELFKPLYKDYCDIAHANGKFAFMHSDGNIAEVYDDLVEIGVDALNSQIFCMDMDDLARKAKGKLTFWGEIDRQHVLPAESADAGREAVKKVVEKLYDPAGGVIAQFEMGPGANPEVATAIFEEWENAPVGR